jgi:hypothetical protein
LLARAVTDVLAIVKLKIPRFLPISHAISSKDLRSAKGDAWIAQKPSRRILSYGGIMSTWGIPSSRNNKVPTES